MDEIVGKMGPHDLGAGSKITVDTVDIGKARKCIKDDAL